MFVLLLGLICASSVAAQDWCGATPHNYSGTNCPAQSSTCCQYPWSPNGWGCCPHPNAVCCPGGYTCCPEGYQCNNRGSSWSVITECVKSTSINESMSATNFTANGTQICKIGVSRPFNARKRTVMVLGDSVSIGYTPYIASLLGEEYDVQHTPNSGDGGACETAYGLQCLDFFLTSSSGEAQHPDLLMFNFGLHNLEESVSGVVPGQADLESNYIGPLTSITQRLKQLNGTKLLFAITSAYLCSVETDDIVLRLNDRARKLMAEESIPTVDLHKAIIDKCGPVPNQDCFGAQNCWCPHCPTGYEWLANSTIVPAIRNQFE